MEVHATTNVTSRADETIQGRVDNLIEKFSGLFSDKVGHLKGNVGRLHLEENATPKFCKARNVPYSIRPAVELELERLENDNIITPVPFSDWATPVVPIIKVDKSVRLCGDYSITLNLVLRPDKHPMPRIEDVFAKLAAGEKFTKLNLKNAYLHLEMDDKSKDLLTINTYKGLYRVNRLQYGLKPATGMWQRLMEQVLQGIPGIECILDDITMTEANDDEHLTRLEKVFIRLSEHGLVLNAKKCKLLQPSVAFMSHLIDRDG
ncbi:PREDICTED: uncharacterized protein K02A2.6-like [Priapulus caudatus]|uniref:Uncharacterized protein K02A2.6-like n=1 Tax=Priapulus caudatus TaxID=37621 RepID=A0ABM1F920_PRICU|nr:PREDICTED: uncharacterized protein K02A2.6-like [Priapulus caudatus]